MFPVTHQQRLMHEEQLSNRIKMEASLSADFKPNCWESPVPQFYNGQLIAGGGSDQTCSYSNLQQPAVYQYNPAASAAYLPAYSQSLAPCTSTESCDSTTFSPTDESQSFKRFQEGGGKMEKRCRSRPNRPYKLPPREVIQERRQAANSRERKRMETLNDGYDLLRTKLPTACAGRKLSKHETLQLAQHYIEDLRRILASQPSESQQANTSQVKL